MTDDKTAEAMERLAQVFATSWGAVVTAMRELKEETARSTQQLSEIKGHLQSLRPNWGTCCVRCGRVPAHNGVGLLLAPVPQWYAEKWAGKISGVSIKDQMFCMPCVDEVDALLPPKEVWK